MFALKFPDVLYFLNKIYTTKIEYIIYDFGTTTHEEEDASLKG